MAERYKSILLFGAPGSGKGTQGQILGTIPGFYHMSSGDIFRSIDIHSDIGKIFCEYSSRGELVPDEITIQFWRQNLHARTVLTHYKPHDDLLVLDGIPRNKRQAEILEEHVKVLKIVYLECFDKERMIERLRRRALKENRADDAREEVIQHRWRVYEEQTQPVLAHYPKKVVCSVDAGQSPSRVLLDILRHVVPVQDAHFHKHEAEEAAANSGV